MWIKGFYREPEEFMMGMTVGFAFIGALGWWTLLAMLLCSHLWRLGGVTGGKKVFRRLGVPLSISGLLVLSHGIPLLLAPVSTVLAFGVLSIGYGMPDLASGDEGSTIGKFWLDRVDSYGFADALTRGTIGFLLGVAYLPIVATDWLAWLVGTILMTVSLPIVEELVP